MAAPALADAPVAAQAANTTPVDSTETAEQDTQSPHLLFLGLREHQALH